MIKLYLSIFLLSLSGYVFSQEVQQISRTQIADKQIADKLLLTSPTQQIEDIGIVPVKRGQAFTIKIRNRYRSTLLRGTLKTLGAGALSYQLSRTISGNNKLGNSGAKGSLLPAVGIGIAAGLKDLFRLQSRQYLHYQVYNRNHELKSSGKKRLRGKFTTIKGITTEDGFVQVYLSSPKAKQYKSTGLNGIIDTVPKPDTFPSFKGNLVDDFGLTSMGECLPDHEVTPCDPRSDSYDECACIPGLCDPDPCDINPNTCDCNPTYCDPCEIDPFACDCNPDYCDPDPCIENPFDCYCDASYCDPDPEPEPDPCADAQLGASKATSFSNNSIYNSAKSNIQTAANDGNEHGVSFGKDANGATISSSISNGNGHSAPIPPITNITADLHNHPDNTPPSSGDLYGFIDKATSNSTYETRYILMADGTVYAFIVTDLQAAQAFNSNNPRVLNPEYEPGFPDDIRDEINEMKGFYGATDETAMAFIMEKYNTGIALLKQDISGNFKRLNTNEVLIAGQKSYVADNCP